MRLARNGTISIAYETIETARSDAPWVVLIHGLGYASWGWEPVVQALAEHFRLVLLDNRGIGGSDVPPGPYDTTSMAGDVIAVLDHLAIERATLIGTSLGGMIAQRVAIAEPGRIDRLVLTSTTPGGDVAYPLPQATHDLIARLPTLPADEGLALATRNALADRTLADRPDVPARVVELRLAEAQDPAGWAAQAAAGTSHDLGRDVSQIACHTLVVHGDQDRVVDVRNAALLGDLIGRSRVVIVPDAGHLLFWDDPARFAEEVVGFLVPH